MIPRMSSRFYRLLLCFLSALILASGISRTSASTGNPSYQNSNLALATATTYNCSFMNSQAEARDSYTDSGRGLPSRFDQERHFFDHAIVFERTLTTLREMASLLAAGTLVVVATLFESRRRRRSNS